MPTDEILRKTLDELENLGLEKEFLDQLEGILKAETDMIASQLEVLLRERHGIN